jgi:8-hydroxy-5-deazaflavin:NADPH oxidoreductase
VTQPSRIFTMIESEQDRVDQVQRADLPLGHTSLLANRRLAEYGTRSMAPWPSGRSLLEVALIPDAWNLACRSSGIALQDGVTVADRPRLRVDAVHDLPLMPGPEHSGAPLAAVALSNAERPAFPCRAQEVNPMKVTIIGAGNMGRGIGTRAVEGGHEVEIIGRHAADARKLAQELGRAANVLDSSAPFGGEVIFLAVYYPAIKDAVRQYADQLAGKVVVDITNPVDTQTWDSLATAPGSSSGEEVQQLVPPGTPVVKAFNTTFAPTLVTGAVDGLPLDVFIAGDDDDAKQKVARLVSDGGLRPIDVGPLRRAQQLEQLGFLHIAIQQPRNLGFGSAIKLHW